MIPRPTYIDFSNHNLVQQTTTTPSPRELLPPRSGDIPPPLSPLDAFALQGRMLAQRLEQGAKFDKRVSRLPQFYVARELAKPRPGYLPKETKPNEGHRGKTSSGYRKSKSSPQTSRQDGNILPAVSPQAIRPQSQYPVIHTDGGEVFEDDASSVYSHRSTYTAEDDDDDDEDDGEDEEMPDEARLAIAQDYFNSWQKTGTTNLLDRRDSAAANSPISADPPATPRPSVLQALASTNIPPEPRSRISPSKRPSQFPAMFTLPRSPASSLSRMTIRAVSNENSPPVHFLTKNDRKTSDSTTQTETRSPVSPWFELPRSPSISSDHSGGASLLPPHQLKVNFSRPITNRNSPSPSFSNDARPSIDTRPSYDRETSIETRPSFQSSTRLIDANGNEKSILYRGDTQSSLPPTTQPTNTATDDPHDGDAFGRFTENAQVQYPSSSRIYARYSLSQSMFVPQRTFDQSDNDGTCMTPVSPTPETASYKPIFARPQDSPRARFDAMNMSPSPSWSHPLQQPKKLTSRPHLRLDTSTTSSGPASGPT